jgi:hypothetical protein
MSKLTVLVLLVSAFVIIMSAQVLFGRYLKNIGPAAVQTNVLAIDPLLEEEQNSTEPVLPEQKEDIKPEDPVIQPEKEPEQNQNTPSSSQNLAVTVVDQNQKPLSQITLAVVKKAGFQNISLTPLDSNPLLFDTLDYEKFISLTVLVQNFAEGNSKIATAHEFVAKSRILAHEIYLLLKEKFSGRLGLTVNEINDFGENSFYINFPNHQDDAFLVVKKSEYVYALSYQKKYHSLIQKLFQLLP